MTAIKTVASGNCTGNEVEERTQAMVAERETISPSMELKHQGAHIPKNQNAAYIHVSQKLPIYHTKLLHFPRPSVIGEKSAWYPRFAHAQLPRFMGGTWKLLIY